MREPQPPYWFAAKRWGQGWGGPTSWQGWLCLAPVLVGCALGFSAPLVGLIIATVGMALTIWGAITHGDPRGRKWNWPLKD